MTQKQYEKLLKSNDENLKHSIMIGIKNRKYNWNRGLIKLSKARINEIVFFQKALNKILAGSELEKEYLRKSICDN